MKKTIAIIMFLLSSTAFAQSDFKIAADGFPTGQGSPEGVACDAIRAYITSNPVLWLSLLLPSNKYVDMNTPGGSEKVKEYEEFKKIMVEKKKQNAKDPNFPKMKLMKVYRARQFSAGGPASMAYAVLNMKENMFVDFLVDVGGGNVQKIRSHVMQDSKDQWYFEPCPDLMPLLAMGLNEESASTEEWTNAKRTAK